MYIFRFNNPYLINTFKDHYQQKKNLNHKKLTSGCSCTLNLE